MLATKDSLIFDMLNSGNFFVSLRGDVYRRRGGYRRVPEFWYLCEFTRKDGYKWINYANTKVSAHRFIYVFYFGFLQEKLQINHKDGNPSNNQKENLELVTAKENCHHAKINKLRKPIGPKGSKCALAKYTEMQIKSLRELHSKGIKVAELARLFNMSNRNVRSIVLRKTWRHV